MTTLLWSDIQERCSACRHYETDVENVEKGASEGCNLCAIAIDCLKMVGKRTGREEFKMILINKELNVILRPFHGYPVILEILWYEEVKQSGCNLLVPGLGCFGLTLDTVLTATISTLQDKTPLRFLPSTTSSDTTFALVKEWLTDCLDRHHECKSNHSNDKDNFLTQVRFLRLTDDKAFLFTHASPDRYVCLSYCWGAKANMPKLLKENLTKRKADGIVIADLPQTFKDAIDICRRFGVNYLWIDALCIIQDDPDDWRVQSAFMADVYENGYFTIAASKARNPDQGCFENDLHPLLQGKRLPGYNNLFARHMYRGPMDKPDYPTFSAVPLLERAWVYQEMCLSPRTIHYGLHEVYWHCRRHDQRQSVKAPFNGFASHVHPQNISKFLQSLKDEHTIPPEHRLRMAWYQMVVAYSKRKLTYNTDSLPAIGAMAKRHLDSRPGDQYLAGLWKSTFLFDVRWTYNSRRTVSPVPDVPSWSWARYRKHVKWDSWQDEAPFKNVEVLDTDYVTDGPIVSGLITKAAITLRAPLFRLCDMRTFEPSSVGEDFDGSEDLFAYQIASGSSPPSTHDLLYHDCDLDVYDSKNDIDDTKTFALPLLYEKNVVQIPHMYFPPYLLMLMIQVTKSTGEYTRIGTVRVENVGIFTAAEQWRRNDKLQAHQQKADYQAVQSTFRADVVKYWQVLVSTVETKEAQVITLV